MCVRVCVRVCVCARVRVCVCRVSYPCLHEFVFDASFGGRVDRSFPAALTEVKILRCFSRKVVPPPQRMDGPKQDVQISRRSDGKVARPAEHAARPWRDAAEEIKRGGGQRGRRSLASQAGFTRRVVRCFPAVH